MEDLLVDSEILHSGKGRDIEQWLEPQNKSFLFVIALLSLFFYLFIIHSFLSINIHLNKIAIEHLNSYLEKSRGEVQSPSPGIQLQFLFWVIGVHHIL